MDDLIRKLSEIRSEYNCFDEDEEPYYCALSEAIRILSRRADGDTISRRDAIMSGCESWYDPETEDKVYKDILEVDAILKCNKEIRIALRNMSPAQPDWEEMLVICDCCGHAIHVKRKGEPTNDLISRQAAIDVAKAHWYKPDIAGAIEQLPPAQPSRIEQALHGKAPEEQYKILYWLMFEYANTYNDARRAVIDWLGEMEIERLPSEQPEPKKGEWILMSDADGEYCACSECGEDLPRYCSEMPTWGNPYPRKKSIDKTDFCPNCGADMRGKQDG